VTLKTGLGSVKVIEKCHYSLQRIWLPITFHSNRGPISYRFGDRRQFQSKIAKFSPPLVFCAPAEVVPLGIMYRRWGSEN